MGSTRKNILWLLLLLLAAGIQATWFEGLQYRGAMPNLVLLLIVYFALSDGEERGMLTGALGGLFQDVAAGNALGHYVLCNVIIGYIVGLGGHRLVTGHPAIKAGIVFISGLAHATMFALVAYLQDPARGIVGPVVRIGIPAAFYTAVVTPFVFIALDTLRRNKRPKSPGGMIVHD